VLRFHLAPSDSPGHLLGWRIVTAEPEVFALEASSPFLAGKIVGRRLDGTHTTITTGLRYGRPVLARVVWACVGPLHRRIAPLLLQRAAAGDRRAGRSSSV
jgi:hypothetical protein